MSGIRYGTRRRRRHGIEACLVDEFAVSSIGRQRPTTKHSVHCYYKVICGLMRVRVRFHGMLFVVFPCTTLSDHRLMAKVCMDQQEQIPSAQKSMEKLILITYINFDDRDKGLFSAGYEARENSPGR